MILPCSVLEISSDFLVMDLVPPSVFFLGPGSTTAVYTALTHRILSQLRPSDRNPTFTIEGDKNAELQIQPQPELFNEKPAVEP